jgi:Fe-S cluster biogenesis protein NfuA
MSAFDDVANKVRALLKPGVDDPASPPEAEPDAASIAATLADADRSLAVTLDGELELTRDNVEAVLDAEVRPMLQADGGDITLVDIDDGDVHVRLVGACSSCASSVMTMRFGVERVLQDRFPTMRDLIQVDDLVGGRSYAGWG